MDLHPVSGLIVIALAALVLSWCARRLQLPSVVGQLVAGIIVGPLGVGLLFPRAESWLFAGDTRQLIATLGTVTASCFLFLAGVEHAGSNHVDGRDAVVVTGGIWAAAGLGALVLVVVLTLSGQRPGLTAALFLVVLLAVCALPVMVRIIQQSGLSGSRVADTAVAVAMSTDVVAWCLVAGLGSVHRAGSRVEAALSLAVIIAVRLTWPTARRSVAVLTHRASGPVADAGIALACGGLGVLGAHAAHLDPLLGALAGGLLYGGAQRTAGRDASARSGLVGRLERAHVVFLPIFFAAAGLSAVRPAHPWRFVLLTLVLSLLAVVCRLVGVRAVARWLSLEPVEVGVAAWLTCARGATEIAMIKVGADLDLLAPTLVGPSIVMALVTTAVSGTVLGRLDTRALARRSSELAQRAGARAAP